MADPGAVDDDEYDVKDEELVDFEGSDYGFESGDEAPAGDEAPLVPPPPPSKSAPASGERNGDANAIAAADADGVVAQPPVVVVVVDPPKHKLPPKPDLEDGELDDAAMPEGSDPEAVAHDGDDDEGENDRRDRKRRKDRYAAERQLDHHKGRSDAEETALAHSRQFRGRGSAKMHGSQRNNYSRGSKGANVASNFQRGNSGPGIMGPGRPPVSMEYGGHVSLRSNDRGFPRPIAGMVAPGRLNQNEINMQNHIRDSMAVQGHILRQQQLMQMAQEQVQQVQAQAQAQAQVQARAQQAHAHAQVQQAHAHAHAHVHAQAQVHMANSGALRASMSGSTMRPIMGLDLIGGQVQASHGMMHLQVQKQPDSGPQINFGTQPLDQGFGTRVPPPSSTDFAAGRGSVGGQLLLNQPNNRLNNRQLNAWSSPSSAVVHREISTARGRVAQGQGRGQMMWAEPPISGTIPTGFPSPLGVIGHAVPVNGVAPGVAMGTPKRQGSLPMMMPNNNTVAQNANMKKIDSIRPQVNGTWRTNGGNNRGSVQHHNGGTLTLYSRGNESGVWSKSSSGDQSGNKRSRENGMDRRYSSKPVSVSSVGNGMGTAGNNLIQLGGPVTKTRVLSVSGFPENTSMAVVVGAFEKQGKILDFKKDEKGNAFHITFSSVAEAVSAKRSLHRTLLNGRQITVDYTVQGY